MLGWEFFVSRQVEASQDATKKPSLASWQTGLGGTQWLDDLVAGGVGSDLGGNGYPNRYTIPTGALLAIIGNGIPKHTGPLVIGDDYVTPPGWTGPVRIDIAGLRALDPREMLLVEAWDQS